jgi:iron(II)-dependent oxidoreductase
MHDVLAFERHCEEQRDEAIPWRTEVIMHRSLLALALLASLPLGAQSPLSEMVNIPAGPFTMGSNDGPEDERPAHEVTLRAYSIDRFPVTNAEYAEFLNAQLAKAGPVSRLYDVDDPDARVHRRGERWMADKGYENHPVVEVPWAGAVAFCESRGKRLPTEAEWEKAARGTDARRYPWGSELPDRRRGRFASGWNETAAVDAFPGGASPYGVREMAGNVWQWVSSAYRPYPYSASDGREDPKPGPVRGTRGGGHDSPMHEITTTQRGRNLSRNPTSGHHNIGSRCALSSSR